MATYAVGDLHGCFAAFSRLLDKIQFNPAVDKLLQVGDLVNRGPESPQVVRWMMQNESAASVVLGNHDIHLLAVRDGFAQAKKCDDGILQLLAEPDADDMCEWIRRRPLVVRLPQDALMVHAGLLPQWTPDFAQELADECAEIISGEKWRTFGPELYGDAPKQWSADLKHPSRFRVAVNAFTRMRACTAAGEMIFPFAGKPGEIPDGGTPWFDAPQRMSAECKIIFGHWSALGFVCRPNLLALDTGCFWGGELIAVRLADGEMFSVSGGDDAVAA